MGGGGGWDQPHIDLHPVEFTNWMQINMKTGTRRKIYLLLAVVAASHDAAASHVAAEVSVPALPTEVPHPRPQAWQGGG